MEWVLGRRNGTCATDGAFTSSQSKHGIETGVDLIEVQKLPGRHAILTTARYTDLTALSKHHALDRINARMDRFTVTWGTTN